jgi:hypothetical protein
MTTIGERYPELTQLHHEFTRALSEDPAPKFPDAFLWYQGIDFERDPLKPSARTRGHEHLTYLNFTAGGGKVPGQQFAPDKTPPKICSNLISRHAADWEGPYQINFRYTRSSEGIWSGFYSVESSAQHRDIVAGRAECDRQIGDALRASWGPDVQSLLLDYGSLGEDPGPRLITRRPGGTERVAAPAPIQAAWQTLDGYLKSRGVKQLYNASYKLMKPNSRLRDGDNVQLIYCV